MKVDLAQAVQRVAPTHRQHADLPVIHPTQAQEADLAAIYVQVVRIVAVWSKGRILPAYTRALEQVSARDSMVRDDIPEVQAEIESLGETLERLILTLVPEMRQWALRVDRWHRDRWIGNVLTATGVDLKTVIGPEDTLDTVETVLARNIALIKDVSAQAQGKVSDAAWRGLQARSPARVVAKDITEAVAMSRRRALNIAADQMQKLSSDLDGARMRAAGIDTWIWRHSRKLHPRAEHKARDMKVYTDKTAPKDMPGQLPFCGCKKQARVVFDD